MFGGFIEAGPLRMTEVSKTLKKNYNTEKAKPRCLGGGGQVLILIPTESKKLLMQWRGPYIYCGDTDRVLGEVPDLGLSSERRGSRC